MKKILALLLAAAMCLTLVACDNKTEAKNSAASVSAAESTSELRSENQPEPADDQENDESELEERYRFVIEADYLVLDTAYDLLVSVDSTDEKTLELAETLGNLKKCSGRYVQESETTDKIYTADVEFYLVKGDIYCSIDYTNFSGTLEDGRVQPTSEEGFLFEAFPEGTFVSKKLDFSIHFSPERLHIEWGGSCDYMLKRETESRDNAAEQTNSFENSTVYQTLVSLLDNSFTEYPHSVVYEEENSQVSFYVEAPESTRLALLLNEESIREVWDSLVESMKALSNSMYSVLETGDYADHAVLYMVDKLDSLGVYTEDDYLLIIDNGTVVYDFTEDTSTAAPAYSGSQSSGISTATTGEKNALAKAKDYLDFMAFSYSGLIEQLEFEGFSHSEAVYGADHCGADWYEQAALKAAEYLDFMSFSRSGLIDQLEYEGFTYDQAVYGVEQNGY